eukprot:scaffold12.g8290.t1
MEGSRVLSHALASSSGLARCSRAAALRPRAPVARRGLACRAVLDLTRPKAAAVQQSPHVVERQAPGETRVQAARRRVGSAAVHSPSEFEALMAANADKLIVLMCKAKCCRPCKMFARKYKLVADHYADSVFCEIFGDESKDTRRMMVEMGVKVTPYFALYRGGARVHGHGGVNEANLHKAIQAQLLEGEAGLGAYALASEEDED